MERLTWRDGVATVLVVLLLSTFGAFLVAGPNILITDNGDMAVIGLGLGFAACIIGGWAPQTDPGRPIWSALSAVALVFAIVVMITENRWWLVIFVGCVMVLWLGTTLGHAGVTGHAGLLRRTRMPESSDPRDDGRNR